MKTAQTDFWESEFGNSYTERNSHQLKDWNEKYLERYGKTKLDLNNDFLGQLDKSSKILEVGSNAGMQLRGFQQNGFRNLYGLEIQWDAILRANDFVQQVSLVQGTALDIPYKSNFFDLVCTHYLLIHISRVILQQSWMKSIVVRIAISWV